MKRTTYIMMGMLLAGLLAVAGTLFYLSTVSVDATNRFVEIGGERKTVQLPACRVVHLMYADVRKDAPIYDFSNLLLDIAPADTAAGSLSYRSGLDRFLTMETVADTLRLVFRQPNEQADVYDEPYRWLSKQSGNMQMAGHLQRLPPRFAVGERRAGNGRSGRLPTELPLCRRLLAALQERGGEEPAPGPGPCSELAGRCLGVRHRHGVPHGHQSQLQPGQGRMPPAGLAA